mmetsp:Transcript_11274/g.12398  ORF Transcript_11274/g.12398 Transcript_11274/m.12398 type:complete len:593 (+) Transcript_11274:274-2052(+)
MDTKTKKKSKSRRRRRNFLAADHRVSPSTLRICLVGSQSGKSGLVDKLGYDFFERTEGTKGSVEKHYYKEVKLGGREPLMMDVLDISTDFSHSDKHQQWFSWASGYLLCYSIAKKSSFDLLRTFVEIIKTVSERENLAMVIIATQVERENDRQVTKQEGADLAELFDCPFFEVSAKTGQNVRDSFFKVAHIIQRSRRPSRKSFYNRKRVARPSGAAINLRVHSMKINQDVPLNLEDDSSHWVPGNKGIARRRSSTLCEYDRVKQDLGLNKAYKPTGAPEEPEEAPTAKPEISNPDKAGWILKEGPVRKSVKRRWLVLKGTEAHFLKSPDQCTPIGSINVLNTRININTDKDFAFDVSNGEKTFIFTAADNKERDSWISALTKASHKEFTFGSSLKFQVKRSRERGFDSSIPPFVHKCLEFLRNANVSMLEGVFRISGENVCVLDLKDAWNSNDDLDFSIDLREDVHTVTSSLKLYFRELPEPLLTFALYDEWIASQQIADAKARVKLVKDYVQNKLPEINRNTLWLVISFLREVADNASVNKMTSSNLSVIFGPTLCRSANDNPMILFRDMRAQYGCVKDCIDFYEQIFKVV